MKANNERRLIGQQGKTSCEKCWADAYGDSDRYQRILLSRIDNPCTPEEQAGEDATMCPACKRKTRHQYTRICMICNVGGR